MLKRLTRLISTLSLATASLMLPASPAVAMPDHVVSPQYQMRSGELLEILKGAQNEEQFFASSFLDAVPIPQFRLLLAQLKTQYGEPIAVKAIIPASEIDGTIEFIFEKATVAMRMVIDKQKPHPVIGLLITGAKVHDDGISKITEEFKALPGQAGFEITDISADKKQTIAALNSSGSFAVGSTFKLYVLAELTRSIKAGQRSWNDVVRLSQKSLPSGVLQKWPDNSPLTLQTLATMMISISDNTATDILMKELGRNNLAEIVSQTGHSAPNSTLPMLNTLEAFALKMPRNDDLRQRYVAAPENEQRRLLEDEKNRLGIDSVTITNLANKPRLIDQVEWFSSPSDVSGLMQLIHQQNDPIAKQILSINPIVPLGDAARWSYIGGKGGSEPGVVSYAFLVTSKSGKTYAVSGSWNDPNAPVDGNDFLLKINRLLNIVASR